MYKLIIFVGLLLLQFNIHAQNRVIDYEAIVIEPFKNDTIVNRTKFKSQFVFKNNGPDTIFSGDIMNAELTLGGYIFFNYDYTLPTILPGGYSDTMKNLLSLSFYYSNNSFFCANALKFKPKFGTISGNVKSNDEGCQDVYASLYHTSIVTLKQTDVVVYPNPAKTEVSFTIDLSTAKVCIYDCLGRIVISFNKGELTTSSINIEKLLDGVYKIQVIDNLTTSFFNLQIVK